MVCLAQRPGDPNEPCGGTTRRVNLLSWRAALGKAEACDRFARSLDISAVSPVLRGDLCRQDFEPMRGFSHTSCMLAAPLCQLGAANFVFSHTSCCQRPRVAPDCLEFEKALWCIRWPVRPGALRSNFAKRPAMVCKTSRGLFVSVLKTVLKRAQPSNRETNRSQGTQQLSALVRKVALLSHSHGRRLGKIGLHFPGGSATHPESCNISGPASKARAAAGRGAGRRLGAT